MAETQADVTRVHRRYLASLSDVQKVRFYKRYLRELLTSVERTVASLDEEMKKPPSVTRGKTLAAITNYLDFAAQSTRRFALGRIKRIS